jgi:3',5'-cyclic AMP phosphodiesterase CpdA
MSISNSISRRKFVLSCLAAACIPKALAATSSNNKFESNSFEPFSFAFISDCHLTSRQADNFMLLQESQLFLQDAIKQINLLRPDFVVFGGDQVQSVGDSDVNWQLFLDVLQNLDCSWHFVLGESDVSGSVPIHKMHTYGRDWKGKGLNNNESYWSCDPMKGVHLIGLDTSQPNSVTGHIDHTQLQWLEKDLNQNPSPLTIVISHHPLVANTNYEKNYLLPQAESVCNLLNKSGSKIFSISGHTHLSKIQKQANIWYVSTPSLDVYPCAFKFFRFTPTEIQIDTYQVHFPALIKKAKQQLANSSLANSLTNSRNGDFMRLAVGNHIDQNAIIYLEEGDKIEAHSKVSSIR